MEGSVQLGLERVRLGVRELDFVRHHGELGREGRDVVQRECWDWALLGDYFVEGLSLVCDDFGRPVLCVPGVFLDCVLTFLYAGVPWDTLLHQIYAISACGEIMRQLRVLFIITITQLGCWACSSQSQPAFEIPEYQVGIEAPVLDEAIQGDSEFAGNRLVFLGQLMMDSGYKQEIEHEQDHTRFRAIYWEDESDATEEYETWLASHQDLIHSIMDASKLDEYFPEFQGAHYDLYVEGDPRREINAFLRHFTYLLTADSARVWFQGDHAGAIERIHTLLRIAELSRNYSNQSFISAMVVNAIAMIGIEHYQWMLENPLCIDDDRQAILKSMSLLNGPDPLGSDHTLGLFVLMADQWLGKQFEIEGGSDELWYQVGMIHGIPNLVSGMFDQALSSKEVSIDKEKLIDELDGIEYEDLVEAYDRFHPFAIEIGQDLISGQATLERLQEIKDLCDEDETGIADLLVLSSARNAHRNTLRLVEQRDKILRQLVE